MVFCLSRPFLSSHPGFAACSCCFGNSALGSLFVPLREARAYLHPPFPPPLPLLLFSLATFPHLLPVFLGYSLLTIEVFVLLDCAIILYYFLPPPQPLSTVASAHSRTILPRGRRRLIPPALDPRTFPPSQYARISATGVLSLLIPSRFGR